MDHAQRRVVLSQLFGSYKAEWLEHELYNLFVQPAYFPELLTNRPCVIIGGRGTGKTTVLRGLSYQGQYEIRNRPADFLSSSPYFGLYFKVNGNRVRAFAGEELSMDRWQRLFAHYVNLQFCGLLLDFLAWIDSELGIQISLSGDQLAAVAASLNIGAPTDAADLRRLVDRAILDVEASINNDPSSQRVQISMQGAPIDRLFDYVSGLPEFRGRPFFICIDEYETYLDYQQQVINTLLKQAGTPYSFKIGVRELGWRARSILDGQEPLTSPSDYVRVDLGQRWAGRDFDNFATEVVSSRLERYVALMTAGGEVLSVVEKPKLEQLLPGLTIAEEADLLGVSEVAAKFVEKVREETGSGALAPELTALSPLERAVLDYWREAQGWTHERVTLDFIRNRRTWDARIVNYSFAALFTIRRGKVGIRKYYAGWFVFLRLAAGNIRYLLELVERSLLLVLDKSENALPSVSPELQTKAAQAVGEKNLIELEQVDQFGPDLMRLVLGLGRIFQMLAAYPHGHTPEVNQFYVDSDISVKTDAPPKSSERLPKVLTAAVRHLALLRRPGTKPTDEASTRADDYMLHPIYAALFQFSYRRKRKMQLQPEDIVGLLERPRTTIREVLRRTRDVDLELSDVPAQLALFESYYDARE
jgi:hypothetical protein